MYMKSICGGGISGNCENMNGEDHSETEELVFGEWVNREFDGILNLHEIYHQVTALGSSYVWTL